MATQPVRRLRTAQASARGAAAAPPPPAPARRAVAPKRTEEVARGFVATSVKDRDGVYDETDRELEVLRRVFEDGQKPAYMKVGAGLTINLGNFESLRVDCAVTIPCLPTELQEAYEIGSNFVADKMAEEQEKWTGTGNAKKAG